MHEYERQWSQAAGHPVRHPLHLKIERLKGWCDDALTPEAFERQLELARSSDDAGAVLLADELLPLWRAARAGRPLPFATPKDR